MCYYPIPYFLNKDFAEEMSINNSSELEILVFK